MKRWIAFLVCLVVLTACQSKNETASHVTAAPDFALRDLSGKTVHLSDYRGKPVFLDFWATWCGPCRMSIPLVQEFYRRNKDNGLIVLGLNIDEDPVDVPLFVKKFKMTYPVLLAGNTNIPMQFNMEGIPLFLFIDKDGNIVERFDGFAPQMFDAWQQIYDQLSSQAA
jgi:thiol-disulfide isomerase/thioredoxin